MIIAEALAYASEQFIAAGIDNLVHTLQVKGKRELIVSYG